MRLHLREWGDLAAPPVVCLHGISSHANHFSRLAEDVLADRFRVVAPDLRGHGESAHEPPWNLETHLADVVETTQAAGIERAVWIGGSFGGRLVLELAAQDPERVERAILLDPAIQILPHVGLDMAEVARKNVSFASLEEAVDARLATAPTNPRELVEEDRRYQLVEGPDGRLRFRWCASAVVTGYSEVCREPPAPETLRCPTLLVYAPGFGLVRDDQLETYSAVLGDRLEARVVPGGHMVLWDAFDEVAAAVREFLA